MEYILGERRCVGKRGEMVREREEGVSWRHKNIFILFTKQQNDNFINNA